MMQKNVERMGDLAQVRQDVGEIWGRYRGDIGEIQGRCRGRCPERVRDLAQHLLKPHP